MRRRELPGGLPPPTKGELKRQALAVQELADRLIDAPESVGAGLDLPEKLADAIALARRITSHGALLRQRQFVAKLMRGIDPEPIRAALEAVDDVPRQDAARFRRAERWRDRLVEGGKEALAEFTAEYPAADGAELARLVTAAVAERRDDRSPGAGRKLFRFVQAALAAAT
ncbi:MAG TPA: ribosome biogenesis factor YjgA [Steroidobacteraceae bacterium]|jgi:ribosome-associated protein